MPKPGYLTPYFSIDELRCRHCTACEVDARLLTALDQLREAIGRPLHVLSGYRCPVRNAQVGGEPNSLHVLGRAADIVAPGMSVIQLYGAALKIPAFAASGIGIYPDDGFVHVDIGRPKPARWARLKGKGYVSIAEGLKHAKK